MARTALTAGVVDTLLEEGGGELRLLFFRDLVFDLSIGVYPHERGATRRVAINLELVLARSRRGHDDDIANVLDYDKVHDAIRGFVTGRHINLLETLVDGVAEICLGFAQVRAVRASAEKLDLYEDCAGVGCEVVRVKD